MQIVPFCVSESLSAACKAVRYLPDLSVRDYTESLEVLYSPASIWYDAVGESFSPSAFIAAAVIPCSR